MYHGISKKCHVRAVTTIKLLFLWTGCAAAIEAIVCLFTYLAYMERGRSGIGGEWILIFAIASGIVYFTDKLAKKINKPLHRPREGRLPEATLRSKVIDPKTRECRKGQM